MLPKNKRTPCSLSLGGKFHLNTVENGEVSQLACERKAHFLPYPQLPWFWLGPVVSFPHFPVIQVWNHIGLLMIVLTPYLVGDLMLFKVLLPPDVLYVVPLFPLFSSHAICCQLPIDFLTIMSFKFHPSIPVADTIKITAWWGWKYP